MGETMSQRAGKASDKDSGLSFAQRNALTSSLGRMRQQLLAQFASDRPQAHAPFTGERDEEPYALENAEINEELHAHAKLEIELIDAALRRMELGSYGVCCDCAKPIPFARLEAYPMARRCIDCKRVYEQRL